MSWVSLFWREYREIRLVFITSIGLVTFVALIMYFSASPWSNLQVIKYMVTVFIPLLFLVIAVNQVTDCDYAGYTRVLPLSNMKLMSVKFVVVYAACIVLLLYTFLVVPFILSPEIGLPLGEDVQTLDDIIYSFPFFIILLAPLIGLLTATMFQTSMMALVAGVILVYASGAFVINFQSNQIPLFITLGFQSIINRFTLFILVAMFFALCLLLNTRRLGNLTVKRKIWNAIQSFVLIVLLILIIQTGMDPVNAYFKYSTSYPLKCTHSSRMVTTRDSNYVAFIPYLGKKFRFPSGRIGGMDEFKYGRGLWKIDLNSLQASPVTDDSRFWLFPENFWFHNSTLNKDMNEFLFYFFTHKRWFSRKHKPMVYKLDLVTGELSSTQHPGPDEHELKPLFLTNGRLGALMKSLTKSIKDGKEHYEFKNVFKIFENNKETMCLRLYRQDYYMKKNFIISNNYLWLSVSKIDDKLPSETVYLPDELVVNANEIIEHFKQTISDTGWWKNDLAIIDINTGTIKHIFKLQHSICLWEHFVHNDEMIGVYNKMKIKGNDIETLTHDLLYARPGNHKYLIICSLPEFDYIYASLLNTSNWSPDGNFFNVNRPNFTILKKDLPEWQKVYESKLLSIVDNSWSPDSNKLVMKHPDLYLVLLEWDDSKQVFTEHEFKTVQRFRNPEWNSKSDKLIFLYFPDGKDESYLGMLDLQTGIVTPVRSAEHIDQFHWAANDTIVFLERTPAKDTISITNDGGKTIKQIFPFTKQQLPGK